MPHLLHLHWFWLFGALSLGVLAGWYTYLLAATRWNERSLHIAIGAAAIVVLLLIARVVPIRYGYRLELGVVLAVVGAIGCLVGWGLRDLADFTAPATRPVATATGSYLFRDALAGMGAGSPYMRTTTGHGSPVRRRPVPSADSLAQAPAPGGYTFPKTLPFADATTSRRRSEVATATGLRRHWTHPAPLHPATDLPAAASKTTPPDGASA